MYGAREPEPWAPVSFLPYRSPHWCQKWDLNGHDGDRGMAQGFSPWHVTGRDGRDGARQVRGTTQGPTGELHGWQRSTAPREPGCPGIPGQRRWSRTWRSSGAVPYTTAGMGTSPPPSLQLVMDFMIRLRESVRDVQFAKKSRLFVRSVVFPVAVNRSLSR